MSDIVPPPHTPQNPNIPGTEKRESLLSRRDFIKRTLQLAVAGALVPGAAATLLPAVAPSALGGGGRMPVLRRDKATGAKIPITVEDLAGEPPVVVTAEWNFLPAVVYKVKRVILENSSKKRGYNTAQHAIQHPTEPNMAIMVYEAKCKHLGCTVGFDKSLGASKDIPDYDEDGANDGRILCPCHQGQYDIHNLALNQPGTPPPKPLNVVRFDVADWSDTAVANAASQAIVGFDKIVQEKYKDADTDVNKTFKLRLPTEQIGGAA